MLLSKLCAGSVLALASFAANSSGGLWHGGPLPPEGMLVCRGGEFDNPPPREVPPTLRVEYRIQTEKDEEASYWMSDQTREEWEQEGRHHVEVTVTFGGRTFTRNGLSSPKFITVASHDGPKDFDFNVVGANPSMRGWAYFSLSSTRLDWRGFCELASLAE